MGECRRCLVDVGGELVVDVRELYEPRPDGYRDPTKRPTVEQETYPLAGESSTCCRWPATPCCSNLPLAPLCRPDCAGLCPSCGADRNEGPCGCVPAAANGRWAALDALRGADTS